MYARELYIIKAESDSVIYSKVEIDRVDLEGTLIMSYNTTIY